jgi:selenocysteine lyase/cysteine desulfurase
MSFDAVAIRADFPIFDRKIRDGKRLVYLDSGATSQKPNVVIDAESNFYRLHNAAAHRGAHQLAEEATEGIESARRIVADFLGGKEDEIIFTKSSTEALNLLAYSIGSAPAGNKFHLKAGDEIVISEMEHHANLIPCAIADKLIRRHPHVFEGLEVSGTDEIIDNWEEIKAKEKGRTSALDGVALAQPALPLVEKLLYRAEKYKVPVALKKYESDQPATNESVGEALASIIAWARDNEIDPENALRLYGRQIAEQIKATESR